MSRETLLDEAIAKAKETDDLQLVEWLRMARGAESAARWYSDKLREAHRAERKLLAENAKLRELVSWMYDRMDESCAVQYPYAPAPISYDRLMQALARARELGVEVD